MGAYLGYFLQAQVRILTSWAILWQIWHELNFSRVTLLLSTVTRRPTGLEHLLKILLKISNKSCDLSLFVFLLFFFTMDPFFGDFSDEEEYFEAGPNHRHHHHGQRPRRQLPQVPLLSPLVHQEVGITLVTLLGQWCQLLPCC